LPGDDPPGFGVEPGNEGAFPAKIFDKNGLLKPVAKGLGPRALKNLVEVLGSEVPQVDDAVFVQAAGNDGSVGQNAEVGGESVTKTAVGAGGPVGAGPFKPAVEMKRDPALERDAFPPSKVPRGHDVDAQVFFDFGDPSIVGGAEARRAVVPQAVIDVKVGPAPKGRRGEFKNGPEIVGVVVAREIVVEALKGKIDLPEDRIQKRLGPRRGQTKAVGREVDGKVESPADIHQRFQRRVEKWFAQEMEGDFLRQRGHGLRHFVE
jgi:hypothetical protein